VTAITDTRLYALERDDFVLAVTGHAPTAAAAHELMEAHGSSSGGATLAPETSPDTGHVDGGGS
jgi:hypothetical protein